MCRAGCACRTDARHRAAHLWGLFHSPSRHGSENLEDAYGVTPTAAGFAHPFTVAAGTLLQNQATSLYLSQLPVRWMWIVSSRWMKM
jgi:hypothetical protein